MDVFKLVTLDYRSLCVEGKYSLTYNLGTIVETLPGTVGIMCFNDRYHAAKFLDRSDKKCFKLLSVTGVEPIDLTLICDSYQERFIKEFYTDPERYEYVRMPPSGTLLFKKVIVGNIIWNCEG